MQIGQATIFIYFYLDAIYFVRMGKQELYYGEIMVFVDLILYL